MVAVNRQQFKRLTIVLVIPLLLLGAWLAESSPFIDKEYHANCMESSSDFSCYPISARTRLREWGGVYLDLGFVAVKLQKGFEHSIVIVGGHVRGFENGVATTLAKDGALENLYISPDGGLTDAGLERTCYLGFYKMQSNGELSWQLRCSGEEQIGFTFQDPNVDKKFRKVYASELERRNDYWRFMQAVYYISIFVPLLAYFLLAAFFWMAIKLVNFIIHGKRDA